MVAFLNTGMTQLMDSLNSEADKIMQEIKEFDPLPTYVPNEEAGFVAAMKPKFKKLTSAADRLDSHLQTARQESAAMDIEVSKILPCFDSAKAEVKRVLTACCINTAARILTSKAAAHSSGNLSQSVESTLDFAKENGLALPKEIIDSLRRCQTKLKEAAAASKTAVAPKK